MSSYQNSSTTSIQAEATAWRARQRQLYQHPWVVYAKTPLRGPAQVLEYLSRYTHRTAISNERIRSVTPGEVAFTMRADDKGGKRLMRLPGAEFVRRFLLHVLPAGVKRIRHYGVLGRCLRPSLQTVTPWTQAPPAIRASSTQDAFGHKSQLTASQSSVII